MSSPTPPAHSSYDLERVLEFEFVRATENAALNAIHWLGRGEKEKGDAAACDAIYGVFDVVDIRGEVTSMAENVLMDAYTQATAAGARTIILNFSAMEYMNSGGIGLLVTLLIRMKRQQQRLLTFGLSDHYRHIFDLTRLDEAIGVYETEVEALAAAHSP